MIWIIVGVATILSCEIFCRTPIISSVLEAKLTASKVVRVLKSESISDHWKEWALPRYAFLISKYSALFFLYLVIVFCPFFFMGLLSLFIPLNFFNFISDTLSIVGITVFAWLYLVMRKNLGYLINLKKNETTAKYNFTSKLLHHLAINSNFRCEVLFDIENFKFSKILESSTNDHHVFVCGLARSGTTVLMRALYQSGKFSSLTYRDMPFVLAPNMWSKITNRHGNSTKRMTRAHDDGILIDFDSPEALEEVFWRVFAGKDYIYPTHLVPHEAEHDVIAAFQDYIALINLKYSRNRYLSKNNNNILRLSSITDAFPNAVVFIPFREPLQHAFSLFKQHQNFVFQHREDKFSEKYMSWLVHHEFGLDHRPFQLVNNICQHKDTNAIDYWLCQWINTYSYLLEKVKKSTTNIFFVGYEDICNEGQNVWEKITEIAKIQKNNDFEFILKKVNVPTHINEMLEQNASEIYLKLLDASRKRMGLA
jgi:Sulfotransferase family